MRRLPPPYRPFQVCCPRCDGTGDCEPSWEPHLTNDCPRCGGGGRLVRPGWTIRTVRNTGRTR